jgi:hypothetical protein
MPISRILLITLLISSIIVAAVFYNLETDHSEDEAPSSVTESTPSPKTETVPSPKTPAVSTRDDSLPPDEVMDDDQIEKEQIAEAMTQLGSSNDEERIEAVEQLGAYPSPETEATLGQLLTTDANAEVRNAAALSLGSLDEPSDATIAVLMSALEDQNEDVRFSSLSTLEDFMLGLEEDAPNHQRIQDGLKLKAASRSIPEDLKESINEVLKDQENVAAPEAEPDN